MDPLLNLPKRNQIAKQWSSQKKETTCSKLNAWTLIRCLELYSESLIKCRRLRRRPSAIRRLWTRARASVRWRTIKVISKDNMKIRIEARNIHSNYHVTHWFVLKGNQKVFHGTRGQRIKYKMLMSSALESSSIHRVLRGGSTISAMKPSSFEFPIGIFKIKDQQRALGRSRHKIYWPRSSQVRICKSSGLELLAGSIPVLSKCRWGWKALNAQRETSDMTKSERGRERKGKKERRILAPREKRNIYIANASLQSNF